jgi:heme/copper-type cytochrome/quinol oxidase subunit 2
MNVVCETGSSPFSPSLSFSPGAYVIVYGGMNCYLHVCKTHTQNNIQRDISIQVLGYWFWWLFIVPSLRSRRPKGPEKKALDVAFLGTPLISILAPVVTKDTGIIWIANFAVVAASYGFAFLSDENENEDDNDDDSNDDESKRQQQPAWLKFVYKSLDFGSGRERGARN